MKNETVGQRIRRLRKEKRITAVDFAREIGVSRANVYRYENDEINKMPYSVLVPIAKALSTSPAYLLSGKEDTRYVDRSSKLSTFDSLATELFDKFGAVEFSDSEISDIVHYVDFVLSKRKE